MIERKDGKLGAPEDLDRARLLPHLRNRPKSRRPAWVEARVMKLSEK